MVKFLLKTVIIAVTIFSSFPFAVGGWYGCCGYRIAEQVWLDRTIHHLKVLRLHCDDPDLQSILDYTIQRYNHVGAWDVMVVPLIGDAAGVNLPFCPGLTLDPEVLDLPIQDGALILMHEAGHDYWPYFGHSYITPLMKRLERL